MAMSGGLDSSMAALLLLEQGFELIGITMKTWDYAAWGGDANETGCCSLDTIHDARSLAVNLGFPHYVLDLKQEFHEAIINNFISEYLQGRTPNPCILCNPLIKWGALLKRADQLGCEYIATGHYARIVQQNNRFTIAKGIDQKKDQSYVLWGLPQEYLSRTLFPLGTYSKQQIRAMALQQDFHDIASKRESYEICFIPDNDYRSFLKSQIPDYQDKIGEGTFVDLQGKVIGFHEGYPFFTIGQRKGLSVDCLEDLYVKEIFPEENRIVLAPKNCLYTNTFYFKQYNGLAFEFPPEKTEVQVKVRGKDPLVDAEIIVENDSYKVITKSPVFAVTPGQSAVFYKDDFLVGGGIIDGNLAK